MLRNCVIWLQKQAEIGEHRDDVPLTGFSLDFRKQSISWGLLWVHSKMLKTVLGIGTSLSVIFTVRSSETA